jgi:hypothetical protein
MAKLKCELGSVQELLMHRWQTRIFAYRHLRPAILHPQNTHYYHTACSQRFFSSKALLIVSQSKHRIRVTTSTHKLHTYRTHKNNPQTETQISSPTHLHPSTTTGMCLSIITVCTSSGQSGPRHSPTPKPRLSNLSANTRPGKRRVRKSGQKPGVARNPARHVWIRRPMRRRRRRKRRKGRGLRGI